MSEAMKTAFIFPGQGAQWVGMGHDLYESFHSAKAIFNKADKVLGFPLSKLCFEGPEDELRQTINAQPAILTVSCACLASAHEAGHSLPTPAFVAGHSLGEYTALAAAEVIDFDNAVYLARERGRLMHEAGMSRPGSMAAIIGLNEASLAEICRQTNTQIANINCPGQLVISGDKENIARAMDMAKAKGAQRTIPLQVSGAFHSPLMQPAADGLTAIVATLSFSNPSVPIIGNTTAQPLTTAESVKEELLRQLCHCIQWQRSVEYMLNEGSTTFIEIGPGKVLTGLVKRINKEVQTVNLGDAEAIKNYQK